MAQIAGGVQLFDEQRERKVLVVKRFQNGRFDAAQQRREGRITAQVRPQHHGVGDVADETGKVRVVATPERRADQQIVLPAVAMQQRGVRREEGHVRGRARAAADVLELRGQRTVDDEAVHGAAVRLNRTPRPVDGQPEHRQFPGQLLAPIPPESVALGSRDGAGLLERVVDVAHRCGRRWW